MVDGNGLANNLSSTVYNGVTCSWTMFKKMNYLWECLEEGKGVVNNIKKTKNIDYI